MKISILIPCYNEEKFIEKCINNIIDLSNIDHTIEIIVIDDFSDSYLDKPKGNTGHSSCPVWMIKDLK